MSDLRYGDGAFANLPASDLIQSNASIRSLFEAAQATGSIPIEQIDAAIDASTLTEEQQNLIYDSLDKLNIAIQTGEPEIDEGVQHIVCSDEFKETIGSDFAPVEEQRKKRKEEKEEVEMASSLFLSEYGNRSPLSLEQVIKLYEKIDAGKEAEKTLDAGCGAKKIASEKRKELEKVVKRGKAARDELIESNMKLVISIARHFRNDRIDFFDLVQEGNVGLMKAVDRFDTTRGIRFATYATYWIRQAILKSLAEQAYIIRLPNSAAQRMNIVREAQLRLMQTYGREPSVDEIASYTGLSTKRVMRFLNILAEPTSISPYANSEDEHNHYIEDRNAIDPVDFVYDAEIIEKVQTALEQVDESEALIIKLRYGLIDGCPHTLKELSQELNLSGERIRQIEVKTLKRLEESGLLPAP